MTAPSVFCSFRTKNNDIFLRRNKKIFSAFFIFQNQKFNFRGKQFHLLDSVLFLSISTVIFFRRIHRHNVCSKKPEEPGGRREVKPQKAEHISSLLDTFSLGKPFFSAWQKMRSTSGFLKRIIRYKLKILPKKGAEQNARRLLI